MRVRTVGPEIIVTATATGLLIATAVGLRRLREALSNELERTRELEELQQRLNEELERIQYESLKAIQSTRNEAVKFFGKANGVIKEARDTLNGLERKLSEVEKELDWKTSETEREIKKLNEMISGAKIELAGIREEIGKIHLALLDFDKRIKETEKNVREAEEIALGVLTRIEEVLENAEERPAEGDRNKAGGG